MKRTEPAPAFQFYASDMLADMVSLTTAEAGLYVKLLAQAWRAGGLPAEPGALMRIISHLAPDLSLAPENALALVRAYFVEQDGRYVCEWQEAQRVELQASRTRRQAAANRRWGKDGSQLDAFSGDAMQQQSTPNADAKHVQSNALHYADADAVSSTQLAVQEGGVGETTASGNGNGGADYPPWWEDLWAAYPRRHGTNSKREAFQHAQARLTEAGAVSKGARSLEVTLMQRGTAAYRAHCDATGKTGTELVMQARRFFGKSRHYADDWTASAPPDSRNNVGAQTAANALRAMGEL